MNLLIPTEYMEDGVSVNYANRVKEKRCAGYFDGNISDPVLANKLVEEGKLDFVGLRPLLADPQWPNKVSANKKKI